MNLCDTVKPTSKDTAMAHQPQDRKAFEHKLREDIANQAVTLEDKADVYDRLLEFLYVEAADLHEQLDDAEDDDAILRLSARGDLLRSIAQYYDDEKLLRLTKIFNAKLARLEQRQDEAYRALLQAIPYQYDK
jgi:hypothetical protein